jgi:hypothetical protein
MKKIGFERKNAKNRGIHLGFILLAGMGPAGFEPATNWL